MKTRAWAAVGLALFGGCAAAPGSHVDHGSMAASKYAPAVKWNTLREGRMAAYEKKMPMLVDFAVPEGCDRCTFLQENVYNREVLVEKINRDFVPVWINLDGILTDDEAALGREYDFKDDCLLLFLDYRGVVIRDPEGQDMCFADKIEPEVFIEYLDHVRSSYAPRE